MDHMTHQAHGQAGDPNAGHKISAFGLVRTEWAQDSTEDVHVASRVQQQQAQNDAWSEDPVLKTHPGPSRCA
jgi:hypothetical protein